MDNKLEDNSYLEEVMEKELKKLGLDTKASIYWNSSSPVLYEHSIKNGSALVSDKGALVVNTTPYTGRSPNDKFTVEEASTAKQIWWGKINKPFDSKDFNSLHKKVSQYLNNKTLYAQEVYAGADYKYALPVRVISESPWHSLFVKNMFIGQDKFKKEKKAKEFKAGFSILHAPFFRANPKEDNTNSEAFVIVNFAKKLVIIGGTKYAGEIKKSIFFVMNYLTNKKNVLGMHCSANIGKAGDTAIYFGLSGTGKTTLSTDPDRPLIGDDEHGWSNNGVFNFEGGCYAKAIKLSQKDEPLIYDASAKFRAILENVVIDPKTRKVDFNDNSFAENTRSSYPLENLDNVVADSKGGHPQNIFFLSADAFGVLPPIVKLSPEQAMYYFISGYTAKVAGTERGVTEPQATFSACFGDPFLPLHPSKYAEMLGDKIRKYKPNVWMINTGWSGGAYGVGSRIKLKYTRALLHAALSGELNDGEFVKDPIFGFDIPTKVNKVPSEILIPKNSWENKGEYTKAAKKLAKMFAKNFESFADGTSDEIKNAGPNI